MYFLIIGTYKQEETILGVEQENSTFEWVLEADNEAEAIAQLEKGETLVSIREISVEERIEREERDAFRSIEGEFIHQMFGHLPIREANKHIREMRATKEGYYLALKYFNRRQSLMRILRRQEGIGKLSVTEYAEVVNKLIDAQTEEEFNKILKEINKREE